MKNIVKITILGLFILFAVTTYAAFNVPDRPQSYVNDYAGILNPYSKGKLKQFFEKL